MTLADTGATCSLCPAPLAVKKHGWCWAHYLRWRKSGDPSGSGKRLRGAPIVHGVYAGYVAGCRCDKCRSAQRAYAAQRRARFERGDLELRHGLWSTYCVGCRCNPCRRAASERAYCKREERYDRLRRGLVRVEHGVFRTYSEFGCRCSECSSAFRVVIRQYDGQCRPRKSRKISRRRTVPRLTAIEIEARNHAFRQEQLAAAVADADAELAELIASQQKDRFYREQGFIISLDARAQHGDGTERYDYIGDEWDDPTFDAVAELVGA